MGADFYCGLNEKNIGFHSLNFYINASTSSGDCIYIKEHREFEGCRPSF